MDLKALLAANEKYPHRAHQLVGVEQLVADTDPGRGRSIPRVFALMDEVGAGKTKQVVDAAHVLYTSGRLDTILVLTPGFARSTWADPDPVLGEVAKHAWDRVPNVIHEFHGKHTEIDFSAIALHWVISNYEFIRRDERLADLENQLRGRRTWLVLDESWAIKGFSQQMRACRHLRNRRADRVTLLNGTPLSDGKPEDLHYQFMILDPDIIGAPNKATFQAKYCIVQPMHNYQKVVAYQNLDDLNRRVAPYVLSRKTRDCFDLPPMLPPQTIEAKLSTDTWKLYTDMRDEMVSWLGGQASIARQAVVKILRLAQITSGFLGGLETIDDEDDMPTSGTVVPSSGIPQWLRSLHGGTDLSTATPPPTPASVLVSGSAPVREIGREKLDAYLNWLDTLPKRPHKLLTWCRFRPELERTTLALGEFYPTVLNLKGGQSKADRAAAKAMLAPGGNLAAGAVVGNQRAGGASLNFAQASFAVYLSNGPALIERTQSIGRIERPGATEAMRIFDVVAVGPRGQKTIDHHTIHALRTKDDMARWTTQQWRQILMQEK